MPQWGCRTERSGLYELSAGEVAGDAFGFAFRASASQTAAGLSMSVRPPIGGRASVLALVGAALLAVPAVAAAAPEQAKLTASDGDAYDIFGDSVALSGDTAVVGAPQDDSNRGSAYVFTRTGSTWTRQARLTASDVAPFEILDFGESVALSGDTAVVGASGDTVGANGDQGSAYVFIRTGSTWTEQAKLTAADGTANDRFGESVAVSGDTAVVGARRDTVGANNSQGSAYVFTRTGSTWTEQAKLTAADGTANDEFGFSVALSGDTAVLGAHLGDLGPNTGQGSAYVFTRTGSTWTEQAKLTAADGPPYLHFGESVAVSGDTAVVGASDDDVGANELQGSAYVFTRTGSTWTKQAKLTAADGAANDHFGESVALSGDTAVVGTWRDTVGANGQQGSAYVFTRTGSTWTEQARLTAFDGAAGDLFGSSVALSGDTAAVGAPGDDVGPLASQGSAYVFTGLFTGPGPPATLDLSPASARNPVGATHCVTATVRDAAGARLPDVTVRFAVTGSVTESGSATTDADGEATFCYIGPERPGADAITAFADANGNGSDDGDSEPDAAATKTWVPPTLDLSPASASTTVGATHCVTATVRDAYAIGIPDVTVRFAVTGSVTESGSATTDADGEATFCYIGPKKEPGADVITAFADINGNGSDDGETEPDDDATKTWTPRPDQAGAPELDQSFTSPDNLTGFINECCNFVAQTFTAGRDGSLAAVNVDIYDANAAQLDTPLRISIRNTEDGLPGQTVLATTVLDSQDVPLSRLITFPQQPRIHAGVRYAIVVNIENPPPFDVAGWEGADGDGYPLGDACALLYGTWFCYNREYFERFGIDEAGFDFHFRTYVSPLPTSRSRCRNGGWRNFGFKNQGQCVAFVERGQSSG
jgi:hypothetical protein